MTSMALASPVGAAEVITYFHNDAAGTALAATDSAGKLVWKESYRPYGERIQNQPTAAGNKVWFHGKPVDEDTGLGYFGARYYDPVVGRFMGVDPKGFSEKNLHSFNRYAYGNNNPNRFVDPSGLEPLPVIVQQILQPYFPSVRLSSIDVQLNTAPVVVSAFARIQPTAIAWDYTIYFPNADDYRPKKIAGMALIAHELQHVLQQDEVGKYSFLAGYLSQFSANKLAGQDDDQAYHNIDYEKDAYWRQAEINTSLGGTQSPAPVEDLSSMWDSNWSSEPPPATE
jgi:RHS repeat-associated protein